MDIMRTLDTPDAGGHHGRRTSRPFPFSDGHHGRRSRHDRRSRHGRRRKRWRSGGLFSVAGHLQGQRQKTCGAAAEGQTVTTWTERRQIHRPDDDGRHMTDGHGGQNGHDGRDSKGLQRKRPQKKMLGSSAGDWFHACRGNGWHIRYSLFHGLYSYPKRQKQEAKTKHLDFMSWTACRGFTRQIKNT